jgi:pyruvate kinase
VGVPGTTNFMRIDTVGEAIIRGQGVGKTAVTGIVHVAHNEKEALEMEEGEFLSAALPIKIICRRWKKLLLL